MGAIQVPSLGEPFLPKGDGRPERRQNIDHSKHKDIWVLKAGCHEHPEEEGGQGTRRQAPADKRVLLGVAALMQ